MTPEEEQAYCESLGGYLCTITTQEEQNFVYTLASETEYTRFGIGGTDHGSEGEWHWLNGEKMVFTNWDLDWPEPNNGQGVGQDYMQMIISKGGKWDDYYGAWDDYTDIKEAFICEWGDIEEYPPEIIKAGPCGEKATWTLTEAGRLVIFGVGDISDNSYLNEGIDISEVIIDEGITSLPDLAFSGCVSLQSISLPEGLESIGVWAFRYCSALTEITIPSTVTAIYPEAFHSCSSLTSISLPNGITHIERSFDYWNKRIYAAQDSQTAKTISKAGYWFCLPGNENVLIKYRYDGDDVAGLEAKCYNTEITTAVIPKGVTNLADSAFSGCASLKSVLLPKGLESIGSCAFRYCGALTRITIPSTVTSIGVQAFHSCTSLSSLVIPDAVTFIGAEAFHSCTSLSSLVIPDAVTSFDRTFDYSSITYLEKNYNGHRYAIIGKELTAPQEQAYCESLGGYLCAITSQEEQDFVYNFIHLLPQYCNGGVGIGGSDHGSEGYWYWVNGEAMTFTNWDLDYPEPNNGMGGGQDYLQMLANKGGKWDDYYGPWDDYREINPAFICEWDNEYHVIHMDEPDFILPDSLTSIEQEAFNGISASVIVIPDQVTSIGDYCFADCSHLRQVFIPENTVSIAPHAFNGAKNLEIFGKADSTAEIFAAEQGFVFVAVP